MATVTVVLNTRHEGKDGLYPIIVRVDHNGQRRKLAVGYRVEKKFWLGSGVSSKHKDAHIINAAIAAKESEVKRYIADCQIHGKRIHLNLIGTGRQSFSFTGYLRTRSEDYKAKGSIIMYRKTKRMADELEMMTDNEVYFDEITLEFLRKFENQLISQENIDNTRHKKFKFLRQFFQQAIAEGKAVGPNPFDTYKIQPKPTKKEKLTDEELKAIEDLKLQPGALADARNIFLFSYYAKGQRFETCATLRREQIGNGRIFFKTNKGEEYLSVKLHARLQSILDLYPEGEFIFPYIKELPKDPEAYINMIGSKNTIVNKQLKAIGKLARIKTPLTMHIARHSFAYHLKKVSDNVNVIQEALGHSDQRTTQIYLKALEDDVLDKEMEKLYGR